MKILVIFLILLNVSAKNEQWDVDVKNINGIDTMYVLDTSSSKEVLKFTATSPTSAFKEAEALYFKEKNKSIIVSRWYRGAHSEVIRVFDPNRADKPLIKEIVTSWPASYEVVKNKVIFLIPVDKYNGSTPKNIKFEWDPFTESNL